MKTDAFSFKIIPQPVSINVSGVRCFALTPNVRLINESGIDGIFDCFSVFLFDCFDIDPRQVGEEAILLKKCDSIECDEGYRLCVTDDLVTIYACAGAGFFYGLQTLQQLLLQGDRELCSIEIEDKPRFSQRGLMLDVSRRYFPKGQILKLLDAMALHKMNRLHLHLTDDQGWRVEIRRYPLLAAIGSHRAYTGFGNKPHSGFYSQQEIHSIVQYASERYIHIVPEVNLPAHCTAAIAAYPSLSCFGEPVEVATHSGIFHNGLCMGNKATYEFCFNVLDEVASVFRCNELHIGGNDVDSLCFDDCPHCKTIAAERGIADITGMHGYFLTRLRDYFSGSGITLTIWDTPVEYDKKTLAGFSLQKLCDYTGETLQDCKSDIYSVSPQLCYDLPPNALSLESCYKLDGLNCVGNTFRGIEALLYTDRVYTLNETWERIFPRLAAASENAWTSDNNISLERFMSAMPEYLRLLDTYEIPHATLKELKKRSNENSHRRAFEKSHAMRRRFGL